MFSVVVNKEVCSYCFEHCDEKQLPTVEPQYNNHLGTRGCSLYWNVQYHYYYTQTWVLSSLSEVVQFWALKLLLSFVSKQEGGDCVSLFTACLCVRTRWLSCPAPLHLLTYLHHTLCQQVIPRLCLTFHSSRVLEQVLWYWQLITQDYQWHFPGWRLYIGWHYAHL